MAQKAHLNGSKGTPKKAFFETPKMSFSRFSNFDLCWGTLGLQKVLWKFCGNCYLRKFAKIR